MELELCSKLRRNASNIPRDKFVEGVEKIIKKTNFQTKLNMEKMEIYFYRNLKIRDRKEVVDKIQRVEEEARNP